MKFYRLNLICNFILLVLAGITVSPLPQAMATPSSDKQACPNCAPSPPQIQLDIASIDWCPYICPLDRDKPGVLVEYVRKIFQDTHINLTFTPMPWARAIHETKSGRFNALLAPAKEEAPGLLFPNQHLAFQHMCLFTRSDDPWQYQNPSSLQGRRIIYAYSSFPSSLEGTQELATFYPIPYYEKFVARATKMLMNNRFNTLLFTYYSTQDYLRRNNLNQRIKVSGCVQRQAVYLAFTPQESQSDTTRQLIDLIDQRVIELKKDNTLDRLLYQYGLKPYKS